MLNKVFVFLVLISLLSCNKKTLTAINKVNNNDFTYLKCKGKIKTIDLGGKEHSASIYLKIKKDSVIWVNVSKSAIQIARFAVRQDSAFFLNKIERNYSAFNLSILESKSGYKFTQNMLENLLLGNLLFPIEATDKVKKKQIIQKRGNSIIVSELDKITKKITKISLSEKGTSNVGVIKYIGYQQVESLNIPEKMTVFFSKTNKNGVAEVLDVEIIYNKPAIPTKKISFPFNIPSSYEKL